MRGWEGLPEISKALYNESYFLDSETYEDWNFRICSAYANDDAHRDRMMSYIRNYWFHPSTPVSSNGGTDRGLPISCYVGEVEDSKKGIFDAWNESSWLGSLAGGVGRLWTNVRSRGEKISLIGESSGVIPFMKVDEALTNAVSQGGLRRMSQADWLWDTHPEIEDFVELRKPSGDQKRRALDLHHGVVLSDEFMYSVIYDKKWDLISPKTGKVVKTIKAKKLWDKILDMRVTTGEPYILFKNNANRLAPEEYKELELEIRLSNLCTEIMESTSTDKTNVCCLGSINLEYWDEYVSQLDQFIADCSDFLDNVLQDFIDKTEGREGFKKARKAAMDERSIGLGVMGWHSLLQSKSMPFGSPMAKGLNTKIFKAIKEAADKHNENCEPCPMSIRANTDTSKRNINVTAIAPTMSISNLCNLASSGIEPWAANAFTKKLKQGSFAIKNKYLDKVIKEYANSNVLGRAIQDWIDEQWDSIKKHNGSVQHLDWMDSWTKDVFKTAFEINQASIVDLASDRTPYIDQGQSTNLFVVGNSRTQDIADLHVLAWKKGLKSLYYLRSFNPNRASTSSKERKIIQTQQDDLFSDTCPSCG